VPAVFLYELVGRLQIINAIALNSSPACSTPRGDRSGAAGQYLARFVATAPFVLNGKVVSYLAANGVPV
jgi:hypothetical protein